MTSRSLKRSWPSLAAFYQQHPDLIDPNVSEDGPEANGHTKSDSEAPTPKTNTGGARGRSALHRTKRYH